MTTAFIISFVFNIFFVWVLWKTLKRNKEYVERSISHTYIMANAEQELINLRAQNKEWMDLTQTKASCETLPMSDLEMTGIAIANRPITIKGKSNRNARKK